MQVLVAGGTGFVGGALVPALLASGHEVTVLSRRADARVPGAKVCTMDSLPEHLEGVINLAGAPINKRWTSRHRRAIRESRVDFTARLRQEAEQRGARVFVSTSAVGFYGDRGDEELTEQSSPGKDFLAQLSIDWEQAAQSEGMRVAIVRAGLVMHKSGGALKQMLLPFKLCVGGRISNGRFWWSWISRDDIAGIYRWALENDGVSGPLNGTAPAPVTNREFTRALGRQLRRPTLFPVPRFALRILMGEAAQVVWASQRALPQRTQELGYQFKHTTIAECLRAAMA